MNLQLSLADAGGAYKLYAKRLTKLGIFKLEDFLYHIPFRYEDFSLKVKIRSLRLDELVTIQGKVIEMKNVYTKRFKKIQEAKVEDETGTTEVIWFNQPFLARVIHPGDTISMSGRASWYNRRLAFISPQYEIIYSAENENPNEIKTIHTGRLVPVYPETKGVSSKWLRRQVYKIIYENGLDLDEYLPYSLIKNANLEGIKESIEHIHFPKRIDETIKAKERLSFDEIFFLRLASEIRKAEWK